MVLRFPKLAVALIEYDQTAPERQKLWDSVRTGDDAKKAELAEKEAWRKVCLAFNGDEHNPNSLENNLLLSEASARKWAQLPLD